jgi:hypothetical protein
MNMGNLAFRSVLSPELVTQLGKFININSCSSSNQADILVYLLNRHLAQVIVVNGRYKKATYGQIKAD